MITISLFALLALALTLLVWVVQLLKNNRAQEELVNTLLERVEVQEELILHKTQEIKTLQEAVFETKESFIPWVESLQQESDEWADIAKDRAYDLTLVRAQATQARKDLQVLIAKLDKGELTPNELAYELSWVSATLIPSESFI